MGVETNNCLAEFKRVSADYEERMPIQACHIPWPLFPYGLCRAEAALYLWCYPGRVVLSCSQPYSCLFVAAGVHINLLALETLFSKEFTWLQLLILADKQILRHWKRWVGSYPLEGELQKRRMEVRRARTSRPSVHYLKKQIARKFFQRRAQSPATLDNTLFRITPTLSYQQELYWALKKTATSLTRTQSTATSWHQKCTGKWNFLPSVWRWWSPWNEAY